MINVVNQPGVIIVDSPFILQIMKCINPITDNIHPDINDSFKFASNKTIKWFNSIPKTRMQARICKRLESSYVQISPFMLPHTKNK